MWFLSFLQNTTATTQYWGVHIWETEFQGPVMTEYLRVVSSEASYVIPFEMEIIILPTLWSAVRKKMEIKFIEFLGENLS